MMFFVFGLTNFSHAESRSQCVMDTQASLLSILPDYMYTKTRVLVAAIICSNGGTVECVIKERDMLFHLSSRKYDMETRVLAAAHICKANEGDEGEEGVLD